MDRYRKAKRSRQQYHKERAVLSFWHEVETFAESIACGGAVVLTDRDPDGNTLALEEVVLDVSKELMELIPQILITEAISIMGSRAPPKDLSHTGLKRFLVSRLLSSLSKGTVAVSGNTALTCTESNSLVDL